ncbi:hypothetical protein [Alteromonas sp. 14N.309.X.WAT.G.H12]|uniref:hypothetical protein n=1 Tax=Alteromonas sp. 14N.309.X.WAT.G.H12 TaxID=3120824 RepID=UPI002FD283DF
MDIKVPSYAKQLQKHLDKIKTECQGISNLAVVNQIDEIYVDAAETALKELVRSVTKDLKAKKEQVDVTLPGLGGAGNSHKTKEKQASYRDDGDGTKESLDHISSSETSLT